MPSTTKRQTSRMPWIILKASTVVVAMMTRQRAVSRWPQPAHGFADQIKLLRSVFAQAACNTTQRPMEVAWTWSHLQFRRQSQRPVAHFINRVVAMNEIGDPIECPSKKMDYAAVNGHAPEVMASMEKRLIAQWHTKIFEKNLKATILPRGNSSDCK
mmetsp:Transcript_49703/g.78668  ORF Transcript_49703/g.78668 Transcript_49703/m.78668 type:complete len:157 (-) Transcript_49703:90-560(-)